MVTSPYLRHRKSDKRQRSIMCTDGKYKKPEKWSQSSRLIVGVVIGHLSSHIVEGGGANWLPGRSLGEVRWVLGKPKLDSSVNSNWS